VRARFLKEIFLDCDLSKDHASVVLRFLQSVLPSQSDLFPFVTVDPYIAAATTRASAMSPAKLQVKHFPVPKEVHPEIRTVALPMCVLRCEGVRSLASADTFGITHDRFDIMDLCAELLNSKEMRDESNLIHGAGDQLFAADPSARRACVCPPGHP
jgi:hypothetical protein